MKNASKIITIIFLALLSSCKKNTSNIIFNSFSKIKELDLEKHDAVLILPSVGCTGCISSTEIFVREKKYPNLLLILTNTPSKKDAEHRLNLIDPSCDYFYDRDRLFYAKNSPKAIYPVIVYLDKNDLSESTLKYIEPLNSDALFDLESFLLDNL